MTQSEILVWLHFSLKKCFTKVFFRCPTFLQNMSNSPQVPEYLDSRKKTSEQKNISSHNTGYFCEKCIFLKKKLKNCPPFLVNSELNCSYYEKFSDFFLTSTDQKEVTEQLQWLFKMNFLTKLRKKLIDLSQLFQ